MRQKLPSIVEDYEGGRLKQFAPNWKNFTSDKWILESIKGCSIEFTDTPCQIKVPYERKFTLVEEQLIDVEISRLLTKNMIIIETTHSPGEYISTIFLRPKKDGGHRLILNLKNLNEKVRKQHFIMQTFTSALTLVTKGCYMASIGWKDAYYSVPIMEEYQKYLKFQWKGKLFQYTYLPNGLSSAPRIFTKLTKPIYSTLANFEEKGPLELGMH